MIQQQRYLPPPQYNQSSYYQSQSSSNIWLTVFTVLFGLMILIALGFGIYTGAKYIVQTLKSNTENKCDTTKFDSLPDGNCYPKCGDGLKRCDNTSKCCFLDREDCVAGKCNTKCQISNGIKTIRCGETNICYDPKIEACSIPNSSTGAPEPKNARKCPIARLNKYGECCALDEVVDINTEECKKCGANNIQCEGVCCLEGEDCTNGTCCVKTDILNNASNDKLKLCCTSPFEKCVIDGKNVCCGIGQKCIDGKCVQPCGNINCVDGEYCYQDLNGVYSCLKKLGSCGEWGPYKYDPPLYDQQINPDSPPVGFRVSYDTNDNSSNRYYNINSKLDANTKLKFIDINVEVPSDCKNDLYCQQKVAERGSKNVAFNNHIIPGTNTCTAKIDPYEDLFKEDPILCPLNSDSNGSCCRSTVNPSKFTGKICNGKCWKEQCICRDTEIYQKPDGSYDIKTYRDNNGIIRKNCDIILDLPHKCNIGGAHPDAVINWATGNCLNKVDTCNDNGTVKVDSIDSTVYTGDSSELIACNCDEGWGGVNCNTPLKIPDNFFQNYINSISLLSGGCGTVYVFSYGCTIDKNSINVLHGSYKGSDAGLLDNIYFRMPLIPAAGAYAIEATFVIVKNSKRQTITLKNSDCFYYSYTPIIEGTNNYKIIDGSFGSKLPGKVMVGFNI